MRLQLQYLWLSPPTDAPLDIVRVDASRDPSTGICGIGVTGKGGIWHRESPKSRTLDNNEAELYGLCIAARLSAKAGIRYLNLLTDSQWALDHLALCDTGCALCQEMQLISYRFDAIRVSWVRRGGRMAEVDKLAKWATREAKNQLRKENRHA